MSPRKHPLPNTPPENVSSLYDDALPADLKLNGVLAPARSRLQLHKGSRGPLSPYVIHLSHGQEQQDIDRVSRLEALARELALEVETDTEEPVMEDLRVARTELREQVRETDLQITGPVRRTEPVAKTSIEAAPVHIPLQEESTIDLLQLIPELPAEPIVEHAAKQEEEPAEIRTAELEDLVDVPDEVPPSRLRLHAFSFGTAHTRAFAAFVALAFIVVLPLKVMQGADAVNAKQADITESGRAALEHLLSGAAALETDRFDVAGEDFARASQDFSQAQESLDSLNSAIAAVVNVLPQTDRTYESVQNLIIAGRSLSDAAAGLAQAGADVADSESATVVTKLNIVGSYAQSVLPDIRTAADALSHVDASVVPEEYQATIEELTRNAPRLADSVEEFIQFSDALSVILGEERKMRYLVVFQNNTELRATGGFTGSFAEMDLLHGEIENIHIPPGGTYDLQGQLSDFVAPPEPLSLLNPRWEFHDANWFPDFPSSAKKMLHFYYEAGGPTVDGVIAINATMIPKLLEILGPVEMPQYGRTIDAENFLFETQKIVEFEYEVYANPEAMREEDAPKQFIADLAPVLLERLENADMETMLAVLDALGEGLVEKDVQLYFESNELQAEMERLGWSGSLKQTDGDYLMVVNTNLGGGKTDTVIDQQIDVDVTIGEDGSVVNTVTITKTHRGLSTALFEGANNVDYIRLYVPRGSEFISASGFEIPEENLFEPSEIPLNMDEDLAWIMHDAQKDAASQTDIWEEQGKTVFGNWMQTKPGESQQITFTYRLPFQVMDPSAERSLLDKAKQQLGFKELETYTLLLQKQSGVETRVTNVRVELPSNLALVWSSHAGAEGTGIALDNAVDVFVRFLLEQSRPL